VLGSGSGSKKTAVTWGASVETGEVLLPTRLLVYFATTDVLIPYGHLVSFQVLKFVKNFQTF